MFCFVCVCLCFFLGVSVAAPTILLRGVHDATLKWDIPDHPSHAFSTCPVRKDCTCRSHNQGWLELFALACSNSLEKSDPNWDLDTYTLPRSPTLQAQRNGAPPPKGSDPSLKPHLQQGRLSWRLRSLQEASVLWLPSSSA